MSNSFGSLLHAWPLVIPLMSCSSPRSNWKIENSERGNLGGNVREEFINPVFGCFQNMGFPPKSSMWIGFSIINPCILGYPYFWKHPYFCWHMCETTNGWKIHGVTHVYLFEDAEEPRSHMLKSRLPPGMYEIYKALFADKMNYQFQLVTLSHPTAFHMFWVARFSETSMTCTCSWTDAICEIAPTMVKGIWDIYF